MPLFSRTHHTLFIVKAMNAQRNHATKARTIVTSKFHMETNQVWKVIRSQYHILSSFHRIPRTRSHWIRNFK